jgi:hypothetical protein
MFTVAQLTHLRKILSEIAPSGFIASKDFVECIERIAAQHNSNELLPEFILNLEHMQLVHVRNIILNDLVLWLVGSIGIRICRY